MIDEVKKFMNERIERVKSNEANSSLVEAAHTFVVESVKPEYSYNFSWMGRPIIQFPQDMIAMQEIIWEIKPDLIIETGIAHGGSLIYYASLLEMISNSGFGEGKVLGIDIDIREHNRKEIELHPMYKNIEMIQGSSISAETIKQVEQLAKGKERVLVVLDSNHTHQHALEELIAYAPLVSKGSYCVVFDTLIEDMPADSYPNRSWGPGDNPKTAVWEYLTTHPEFEIDKSIQNKLLITVARDGYLKRIK
jgi:cephalosporin hydroxylase|tara:strand:+ start:36 stop:785 length:750 start_codon:yes stop_codon:yes gene_type:complete